MKGDCGKSEKVIFWNCKNIYSLVHGGKPYFLSRPRRFGKSLFLSTLRYYFEGRRELFEGLRIFELEKDNPEAWQPCPVFYFDFNKDNLNSISENKSVYGQVYS